MAENKLGNDGRVKLPPQDESIEPEKKPSSEKKRAIALTYDVDENKAPLIVATGKGSIAEEIVRVAEENNIPLYEDKALAELLSKIELDTEIPPELYVLVAEVLFFVYRLERMAEKRDRVIKKSKEAA